jgi:catechol 2,3-dioxygenase-like lactoylglutathione lyase family enzyme
MENSAPPERGDILRDRHAAELSRPFLRLNFATLWVRDQERSRRFFVDRLGFQVAVDAEVPGVGRWIIVTPPTGLPGIALVFHPAPCPMKAPLPTGEGWLFEPKWDGFRALVFRDGEDILIQSRDEKPLNRYFPELLEPLQSQLPARCVLDGEIVIVKKYP